MSWSILAGLPRVLFDVNGDPYSGAVLKAYLPGTTTSTSLAIDSTGSSPQASITYNAEGKLEVSGNEIQAYIDRKCKYGIFANATDAAANTPFQTGPFDNVEQTLTSVNAASQYETVALAQAATIGVGDLIETQGYHAAGDGGHSKYRVVADGTGTEDGGEFINSNPAGSFQLQLLHDGTIRARQFGAKFDNSNDDSTAINNSYQALGGGNDAGKLILNANGGQCRCDSTLLFDKTGIQVSGDGYVVINSHVAASNFGIDFGLLGSSNMLSNHITENIGLVMQNDSADGIRVRCNFSEFKNVTAFVKNSAVAWKVQGGTAGFGTGPYYNVFYNCWGNGTPTTGTSQTGWQFSPDASQDNLVPNSNRWFGGGTSATDTAWDIDGGQGNFFYGTRMEGTRNTVMSCNHPTSQSYCNGNVFYGAYVEGLATSNPDVFVAGANCAASGMEYPFLTSIGSGAIFTDLNTGNGNFFKTQIGSAGGTRIETSDWQFISPAIGDYLRFKGPRIGIEFEDSSGGVVMTQKNVSSIDAAGRAQSFTDGATDLLEFGTTKLTFRTSVSDRVEFDSTATAGNTSMLLWDVDNATLERVTVGAADSGGVGYKVLRIPN
ncbi:hypothetical protein OAP25_02040 [Flavobacteriaceae bacterium]|nr:hypothetical protein [Flavobacteriaceae bacterium]